MNADGQWSTQLYMHGPKHSKGAEINALSRIVNTSHINNLWKFSKM